MKTIGMILLIGIIFFVVGRLIPLKTPISNSNDTIVADSFDQLSNKSAQDDSSLSNSEEKLVQKETALLEPLPVEKLIEKNKFQEKNQLLREFFSKNETGQKFVTMFTFMSMQEMNGTPESALVDEAWDALKEMPYEAIDEFKKSYKNIPEEFTNEVVDSIQLLSRFDIPAIDRLEFLKEIANSPVDKNEKNFIPTIAFISMKSVPEGKEFMRENIEQILNTHKKDQDLLVSFIHEFGISFPNEAKLLSQKYLK